MSESMEYMMEHIVRAKIKAIQEEIDALETGLVKEKTSKNHAKISLKITNLLRELSALKEESSKPELSGYADDVHGGRIDERRK